MAIATERHPSRWRRLLRHRWHEDDARRVLGDEGVQALELAVVRSERAHRGEIRVCIEGGLPFSYLWRRAPARERACMLFAKLGVWDTEHRTGVLIYLLLGDRAVEIVADRGLDRCVPAATWDEIVTGLAPALRAGQHAEALGTAIEAVDALLRRHFPLGEAADPGEGPGDAPGPDTDELPNPPVLL